MGVVRGGLGVRGRGGGGQTGEARGRKQMLVGKGFLRAGSEGFVGGITDRIMLTTTLARHTGLCHEPCGKELPNPRMNQRVPLVGKPSAKWKRWRRRRRRGGGEWRSILMIWIST